MKKVKQKHPTTLRSPVRELKPGESGVWSPSGDPGPGSGIASVVHFLTSGLNAKRLRPWVQYTYPPSHQQFDLNVEHRKLYGIVGPWIVVTLKFSAVTDLIIVNGVIGKGSFSLAFRIRDGEDTFILVEEKQSSRAQVIVGEFKGRINQPFPFVRVEAKVKYLSHLVKVGMEYFLRHHQGG